MAKSRQNSNAEPTERPAVDDRSRQAFMDELEGRVPIEPQPTGGKRRIKVKAEVDAPTSPLETATDDLAAVLPDAPADPNGKQRFDQAKKRSPWGIVIVALVVLAAVTVAGFFFWSRGTKFNDANVGLRLTVVNEVASGDTVTLTARYQNDETVDLKNVELSLSYPDGFTAATASIEATNEAKNNFEIGVVKANQVGEVVITGQIAGAVGSTINFSGSLSYRPVNFNSDFTATAAAETTISSSIVTITIDGPKKIAPNGTGTWTLNYQNTSERAIDNLQAEVVIPKSLTVTGTDPKPTDGSATWRLPSIPAGKGGTIKVTGKVTGSTGDSVEVGGKLGLVKPGNVIEQQADTTFLTAIVETGLSVSIAANGVTESSVIKPGDPITYTIRIENLHDAEMNEVSVAATFAGGLYDLDKRQDTARGVLKNQTITWTKALLPGLATVKPNDVVTINLTVPTKAPTPVRADADRNPQGSISVGLTSPDIPDTSTTPTVLVTKVATILTFSADARYYDDQGGVLGSGPVPPKVGQTTNYRVTWTASSTTNDVTTFSATAVLPLNVIWTGRHVGRDAGDITFDPVSRTVAWTVNKVPGGTGSRYPVLTATFEVSITPSADQIGSTVVLSELATAAGTDSSTGQKITTSAESLSSDVPNDPNAAGEGKVQP